MSLILSNLSILRCPRDTRSLSNEILNQIEAAATVKADIHRTKQPPEVFLNVTHFLIHLIRVSGNDPITPNNHTIL